MQPDTFQPEEIVAIVLADAMRGGARLTVGQIAAVLAVAPKYPRVAAILKETDHDHRE
jgi:hypothetical protein